MFDIRYRDVYDRAKFRSVGRFLTCRETDIVRQAMVASKRDTCDHMCQEALFPSFKEGFECPRYYYIL
jgi:hypothetical protein